MFLSALLMRGSGFLASFMVARWVGPSALGVYSATVNTAGAVVQPVLGAVSNGSTLSAGASVRDLGLRRLLKAYLGWIGLALLVLTLVLYQSMKVSDLLDPGAHPGLQLSSVLLIMAGAAVMGGTLLTAAASGLLAGAGQFLPLAKVLSVAAALLMLLSYPAVAWGGLNGALVLAAFTACLPALLAVGLVHRLGRELPGSQQPDGSAWRESRRHLVASSPSVVAWSLNSAVNWACTIYLVQASYGAEGVAVVAVGTQWLTLMLMPVTSWGAMVLKELLVAREARDHRPVGWRVVSRLVWRNLAVTAVVTIVVGVLAGLIARAYGLKAQGLQVILWVNTLSALTAAITNVLERLFVCEERQVDWMVISALGLAVQLAVTWAVIDLGLWVVPAGAVLANVVIGMFALFWRRLWPLRGRA